jgi:hypothetical protein|nr:MAG TPA: hypothetical protein [Caudoviricetes sp.]
MIEQSVSLASNGVVKVPGYEQLVRFGYTKNRGVYRLHVDATGEWEGMTIRAFWHVPDGKDPASSLVVDGYVAVPASVTAQPGNGCITFEGSDGTKTVTSADLHYRVSANSGTEDGTEPEPGTPAWQQLVDAVHTDATAAEQAKTDAQTAAQQAGASAKKAGQALSDTITAKEDALKAIGDKQTAATQAVDTARDKALKQVEASTKAAQTAASEAATSAGNSSQSAQEAADSLQELKDGIANGDFKGEKGDPGPAVALDTTLTHEGEAADAKATGDAISAVKARQNILTGTETGNPISVDDAFPAPLCGLTVYGKSTQDGTPTPDAPVPIVSAGDGGSITVTLSDGNGKTQTLTLPTPNGLPGIPVTSGGNYTDSTGQQWVCDEVDLERGVKVQMVTTMVFSDSSGFAASSTTNGIRFLRAVKNLKITDTDTADANAFCSALALGANGGTWLTPDVFTITKTALYVRFKNITSLGELQQYLQQTPMSLTAILATPIETPLFPAEIAAYKALTAYAPDTVVQASDGAGIKLDYQRDVNLVVKNLEDAIASMTTT